MWLATLQVLMCTRNPQQEEKLAALAVISGLVSKVQEEYLVLLPEALPFLAELLEDTEPTVVAATQTLLKKLEELSGQSLNEYMKV